MAPTPPAGRPAIRWGAVRVLLAPTLLAATVVAVGPAPAAHAAYDVGDFLLLTDGDPPRGFEGYGDLGRFRLSDHDLPPDLEAFTVRVRSTSDPVGVPVLSERRARNDASYSGGVRFAPADGVVPDGALRVRDGDTVTVEYAEAQDADGRPRVHERSATWSAVTRTPDFRHVGLVDTAEAPALVRGARAAAPPGATVRVYDPAAGDGPVLTGTADEAGRFVLTGAGDLPPRVDVTAQEPGLPESVPLDLRRARLSGRVVTPDTRVGLVSAIVEVRPDGAPDPCAGAEGCTAGSQYTDHDGHAYVPGFDRFTGGPGAYQVVVHPQEVTDEARYGPKAYGRSSPSPVVLPEGDATVEVGELPLEPPQLEGEVRDSLGLPVVDAMIDIRDPQGELVTNDYSRGGGGFGLNLPDGDYAVSVRGPYGCQGYGGGSFALSVRDGTATPPTVTVVLERFGVEPEQVSVPTAASLVGTTLRLERSGLEVALPPDERAGSVTVGCTSAPVEDRELVRPPVAVGSGPLAGEATVCLDYDPARAAQLGADEDELELLRVEGDGSTTAIARGPEPGADRLCGRTASLSTFAVALPGGSAPVPDPARARPADDSCPSSRVPEDGMTDVATDHPHEASIDCALWWGVARGRTSAEYAPARSVTRAQMATFIANLVDRSGGSLPMPTRDWFRDDDGTHHEQSINRLAEAGIVRGRADGGYGPDVGVDRDAMATFLVRAYEARSGEPLAATRDWFADDDGNAHEPSIDRAADAGFTGGAAGGGYMPRSPVTRGAMASFLVRVLDLLVERGHGTPPP